MVQVKISDGILEGELLDNEYGSPYYSFKGIPYAEPPVGDLRYKAPQPVKPWDGVHPAKEFGSVCYQEDIITKVGKMGSEDCLYINVYSPDVKSEKPLPVMVWIHGGGFVCGSGNDDLYGPEFLIRHEVILVTFNYRLDVLGFLSLDTEEIPGNAGMKDQVAALRWVKKNIRAFGGDPGNITIFGESAGGASVGFLLISPMSKGLFKRAIVQSGSSPSWWANTLDGRERALALAAKLGCHSKDDNDLNHFFKTVPVESITNVVAPILLSESAAILEITQHAIVSEKKFGNNERFFYGDILDVLRNGIHEGVEVINGFVKDEGIVTFGAVKDMNALFDQANRFSEFFVPKQMALNCRVKDQLDIGKIFREYYMKGASVSPETFMQLCKHFSVDVFTYNSMLWQKICASNKKNKLYLYKFTCISERNFMAKVIGFDQYIGETPVAAHTDDLSYLFPIKLASMKVDKESETFKLIDKVTALWTNFAKYGDPTPDNSLGVQWPPYDLASESYLDIGRDLVPATKVDEEELQFWNNVYKKYLPEWAFP